MKVKKSKRKVECIFCVEWRENSLLPDTQLCILEDTPTTLLYSRIPPFSIFPYIFISLLSVSGPPAIWAAAETSPDSCRCAFDEAPCPNACHHRGNGISTDLFFLKACCILCRSCKENWFHMCVFQHVPQVIIDISWRKRDKYSSKYGGTRGALEPLRQTQRQPALVGVAGDLALPPWWQLTHSWVWDVGMGCWELIWKDLALWISRKDTVWDI